MTTINPHAYTITVRQRSIEGEMMFEATVAELPDVRAYGDTYAEAYESAIIAVASLAEDAQTEGSRFPEPQAEEDADYSGRVTLRLSKIVHRMAADRATAQGVSFNSYLASVIAMDVARADTAATITRECQPLLKQLEGMLAQRGAHAQASAAGTLVLAATTASAAPIGAGMIAKGPVMGALDLIELAGVEQVVRTKMRPLKVVSKRA